MKNFENVKNFKGFIKNEGYVDLCMLPKKGGVNGTKNDRDLTYHNVKHGCTYAIPVELPIYDGENIVTINTTFTLKTMYRQEKVSDYVCVLAHDEIENVIMTFNEMMHTKTLIRRIKDSVIKYYEKNEANRKEKFALKDMLKEAQESERKAQNEKNEATTKLFAEEKDHENTRYEKAKAEKNYKDEVKAHEETKNELMVVKEKLNVQVVINENLKTEIEDLAHENNGMKEQAKNIFTVDDIEYLRYYLTNNNISNENLTKVMNAFVERKFN